LGTPKKPIKTYERNVNDFRLLGRRYVDKAKLQYLYEDNLGEIRKAYISGKITWDQARASYLINEHCLKAINHPTIALVNKNNPNEVICATETSREIVKYGDVVNLGVDSNNKPLLMSSNLYGVVCRSISQ